MDVRHVGMRLQHLASAAVEQRERADEREVLAEVFLGRGLVDAAVELIVLRLDLQLSAVDPALAVDVGEVRLHTLRRAGEQSGHRPREDRDVGDGDRVGRDADVGRAAVAAFGRGGRCVSTAAPRRVRAASSARVTARSASGRPCGFAATRAARGAGSGRAGCPAAAAGSSGAQRLGDLGVVGSRPAGGDEEQRGPERDDAPPLGEPTFPTVSRSSRHSTPRSSDGPSD